MTLMAKIIFIMDDQLEKYIRQHRAQFDEARPSAMLWDKIAAALDTPDETPAPLQVVHKRNTLRLTWQQYASIAAIGLLLLAIGGALGSYWTERTMSISAPMALSLGDINDEYAELEHHYQQQVRVHLTALEALDAPHQDLLQDIEELNAAFEELKQELGRSTTQTDEEIIHAMIENYQTRIEILERVRERLQSTAPDFSPAQDL